MTQTGGTGLRDVYERDGYYYPLRAMRSDDAKCYVAALETHEIAHGGPLQSNMRHQVHVLFTWANKLLRHAKILDPAADLDPAARAVHADATQRLTATLYSGTDRTELRA